MGVADPAAFGLLEPAALSLGIWSRAVELVLQVLRVDALAPALPSTKGLLVRQHQAPEHVHRARKGGQEQSDSSGSSESGGARTDSSDE